MDVVANQARLDLAVSARSLATDVLKSVERRIQAGAAPEAELFEHARRWRRRNWR